MRRKELVDNKKLYKNILILMLLIFQSSCTTPESIKNEEVKTAVSLMSEIEAVEKIRTEKFAVFVLINIYVTEEFNDEDAEKILTIAKDSFTVETINNLMEEFEFNHPPDTNIEIRNADGVIFRSFYGSCYDDYDRTTPPDYEEYQWNE